MARGGRLHGLLSKRVPLPAVAPCGLFVSGEAEDQAAHRQVGDQSDQGVPVEVRPDREDGATPWSMVQKKRAAAYTPEATSNGIDAGLGDGLDEIGGQNRTTTGARQQGLISQRTTRSR